MKILIAEDDLASRRTLEVALTKLGHEVVAACDGLQAWTLFQDGAFSFIISDWMMPGLDGLDLCRRVRERGNGGYVYLILLTARSEKSDVVEGMNAGADDFITKPFDRRELEVRVRAGQRILELEAQLLEKSDRLQQANERMRRDLAAAASIQRTLLPPDHIDVKGYRFAWGFEPCAFVAGDILNVFPLDDDHWAFYLLDVSGHGVPAALFSVAVSRMLSPVDGPNCIVRRHSSDGPHSEPTPPAEVVASLRDRFPRDERTHMYFTLTYAVLNIRTGDIDWVRAGHTRPLHVPKDGSPLLIDDGFSPAIGLLPGRFGADEPAHLRLAPGDRFCLYSDGITESRHPRNGFFTESRLAEALQNGRDASVEDATRGVLRAVVDWAGPDGFEDDMSILTVERLPAEAPRLWRDAPHAHALVPEVT